MEEEPVENLSHNLTILPHFRGSMSENGEIKRLELPPIKTLITDTKSTKTQLSFIEDKIIMTPGGITPIRDTTEEESKFGLTIDIGLKGAINAYTANINPAQSKAVGTRIIPSNWEEAKNALPLISTGRSGHNSQTFSLVELRSIASSLGLDKKGQKHELVNRLQTKIKEYWKLS